jgi:N-acetylneuraminic acid mutarotase
MSSLTRRHVLSGAAALGISGGLSGGVARAGDPPMGSWSRLADMPFEVQEIYPTSFWLPKPGGGRKPKLFGQLVSAGGLSYADTFPHGVSNLVTIYDPETKLWWYGPPLIAPRHHLHLVNHKGWVFALGGFTGDAEGLWRMQSTVWRLNSLTSTTSAGWTALTSLPVPQAEASAASLLDRVHIVGGRSPATSRNRDWTDHIDVDLHWAYDPASDKWEQRTPLPTPRNSAATAVYNNALYVIGGRTVRGGNTNAVDVYEPLTNRWMRAAPMPKPKREKIPVGASGHAAALWKERFYVFGGEWFRTGDAGVYSDVYEYDPREDKWRVLGPMPNPRHGLGAVALHDGVYVCGGATGPSDDGQSAIFERFLI